MNIYTGWIGPDGPTDPPDSSIVTKCCCCATPFEGSGLVPIMEEMVWGVWYSWCGPCHLGAGVGEGK